MLIPVDLSTQRAGRPIVLPGRDGARAVVVTHDGRTVLAASGTSVIPVDPATRAVGLPLDLGPGRTIAGMALSPTSTTLYALVPDGVVPVDTATARAGVPVVTGLTVSSVSSPHGLVVSADGVTVYVVGQGGPDFGGRLLPIDAATGVPGAADELRPVRHRRPGGARPHRGRLHGPGRRLGRQLDRAGAGVRPRRRGDPVRLPIGRSAAAAGTDHPSDIVTGPGATGAFVVAGLDTVLPFTPSTDTFGSPIRVCEGASSMAVAG